MIEAPKLIVLLSWSSQQECQIKNGCFESCSDTCIQYTPRCCWLSVCHAVSTKTLIAWLNKIAQEKTFDQRKHSEGKYSGETFKKEQIKNQIINAACV